MAYTVPITQETHPRPVSCAVTCENQSGMGGLETHNPLRSPCRLSWLPHLKGWACDKQFTLSLPQWTVLTIMCFTGETTEAEGTQLFARGDTGSRPWDWTSA